MNHKIYRFEAEIKKEFGKGRVKVSAQFNSDLYKFWGRYRNSRRFSLDERRL
ncbi:MAG: hypothetical protein LBH25_00540 [Fibromonadaceae bacterium]|jgi:hypothetical protein|nr:hypothetical protein [Fibromonadaceae bacterium]